MVDPVSVRWRTALLVAVLPVSRLVTARSRVAVPVSVVARALVAALSLVAVLRLVAMRVLVWVAAPARTINGVATVARTLEGGQGYGCARALASRSNVVADVDVCDPDASTAAEHAAAVVTKILDKMPG